MKLKITKGGKQVDLNELFSDNPRFSPEEAEYDGLEGSLRSDLSRGAASSAPSLFPDSDYLKAMDKLHNLVCVRERSAAESYERLIKHGFEPKIARKAIDRAVECGLISDERYAQAYVRGKLRSGWGKNKILGGLRANGIDEASIASCDYLFPSKDEELSRAIEELAKRPACSKNPRMTYIRRLVQKGYSQDVAYRAVNDYVGRHIS